MPGLLLGLVILAAGYWFARQRGGTYRDTEPFSARRLGRSFVAAIPAFILPVIIVGGIIGGLFTPTEAAAFAAFAGLVISLAVYREMRFRDIPDMLVRAATVSSAIMMIIGTAGVFSWLIAILDVPAELASALHGSAANSLIFLLLTNLLVILIGMFMEGIAAILVLVPVLLPVAESFGVDPLHFGVIVIINLSIGMITPPYGITLYVAAGVADRTVLQVARRIGLPLALMIGILILATLLPETVTFLPDLLMPVPAAP